MYKFHRFEILIFFIFGKHTCRRACRKGGGCELLAQTCLRDSPFGIYKNRKNIKFNVKNKYISCFVVQILFLQQCIF